jgi:hypothetical protein
MTTEQINIVVTPRLVVIGMCTVLILTDFLFFQSLEANALMVPRLGHDRFLPNHSQFINYRYPIIRRNIFWILSTS